MKPLSLVVTVVTVVLTGLSGTGCSAPNHKSNAGTTSDTTGVDTASGTTSDTTGDDTAAGTNTLPAADVEYVDAGPTQVAYDGVVSYQLWGGIDKQTWQTEDEHGVFMWAGFQSPAVRIPALPGDLGGLDSCEHVVYDRAFDPPGALNNLDVGGFVGVAVGDDSILMKRVDWSNGDDDVDWEYWYDPDNPTPGYAMQTGASIVVAGTSTGVVVPPALDLVDFGTTWTTYLSFGKLVLQWVAPDDVPPGGFISVVIWASDPVTYDSESVSCDLEDDGDAVIDAPFDSSVLYISFSVARQQVLDLDHPDLGHLSVVASRDLQLHHDPTDD